MKPAEKREPAPRNASLEAFQESRRRGAAKRRSAGEKKQQALSDRERAWRQALESSPGRQSERLADDDPRWRAVLDELGAALGCDPDPERERVWRLALASAPADDGERDRQWAKMLATLGSPTEIVSDDDARERLWALALAIDGGGESQTNARHWRVAIEASVSDPDPERLRKWLLKVASAGQACDQALAERHERAKEAAARRSHEKQLAIQRALDRSRRRRIIVASVALAIAVVIVVAGSIWLLGRTAKSQSRASERFQRVIGPTAKKSASVDHFAATFGGR